MFCRLQIIESGKPDLNMASLALKTAKDKAVADAFERAERIFVYLVFSYFLESQIYIHCRDFRQRKVVIVFTESVQYVILVIDL